MLDQLLDWADVVLVEFPWQFEHCRRRRPPSTSLVLAAHNVEYLKFQSWARAAGARPTLSPWIEYVRRAEARAVAECDLVVAVSAADRDTFCELYNCDPARVAVVPNGADTEAYVPVDDEQRREAKRRLGLADKPAVVFAGADVAPNRAGLRHVRAVAALTDRFTFLVVGSVAPAGRNGNLVSTGFVDDLTLHLQAADLALCPIEHGGGTKIKLLESLSAGLPTVVFEDALRGLKARDREEVLVAEKSPQAILAALEELADERALARRLSVAGRRLVVDRYSWGQSAATLDEALQALLARRPPASGRATPPEGADHGAAEHGVAQHGVAEHRVADHSAEVRVDC
jgi:glycosyltransferase involved in cell wall biosynthesis